MASTAPTGSSLPRAIGPYRIQGILGQGGTAIVYLAEQIRAPRRVVALKVIKSHLLTEESVVRFERELKTLAALDHPNIARVYDFAARGRESPYFTMEYLDGAPLTEFCDRERLTVRERVELFLQVCNAVQYVHQRGVIHRDLKPSNMLVSSQDGAAVAKLIDFGIAKLNHEIWETTGTLTQQGQAVGTLCYMSPEQAGLHDGIVDTRADVYGLGVVLYELLAGALPFPPPDSRAGYSELLRRIREDDPPRPSVRAARTPDAAAARRTEPGALVRALRGELDWVVGKALEKQPARRYATVLELKRDLEAYLAEEPVAAHPPSAGYRLRKAMRRHRRAYIAAAVLFVALAVSSTLGTLGYLRLDEEHNRRIALLRLAERVQVEVANAHLWFEEKLSGDASIDLERDVYGSLDQAAARLADALGGRDGEEDLDADLRLLLVGVEQFRRATRERWKSRGSAGDALDQRYDESYEAILRRSRAVGDRFDGSFGRTRSALARTLVGTNAAVLAALLAMLFVTVRIVARDRKGS